MDEGILPESASQLTGIGQGQATDQQAGFVRPLTVRVFSTNGCGWKPFDRTCQLFATHSVFILLKTPAAGVGSRQKRALRDPVRRMPGRKLGTGMVNSQYE